MNRFYHSPPLGTPMPDSVHAVSVSLPFWADVIGYEEKEPRVLDALRACYPRFVFHPLVREVFAQAEKEYAKPREKCLVFPSREVAALCGEFIKKGLGIRDQGLEIYPFPIPNPQSLIPYLLTFPESALPAAKSFWQHTGLIISSRQAEAILAGTTPAPAEKEEKTLRERIAMLSGASPADIYLFPCGMAAIFTAYRVAQSLLPGEKTIQLGFPYVDTLKIQEKFSSVIPAQAGIHSEASTGGKMDSRLRGNDGVYFIPDKNANNLSTIKHLLAKEKIAALFCEFPTNPLLYSIDLEPLSALLRRHGVPLILDDTIATCNANLLLYADMVATSLTKSFSGGGDVLGGSLALNAASPLYKKLKDKLEELYQNICYPDDIRVLEKNSCGAETRILRTNAVAEALCDALRIHPKIARIYYPKYTTPEIYNKYKKPGGGYGSLFSLVFKRPEDAQEFYDKVDICKGPSFGNRFTLACPYTLMAHYDELQAVNAWGVASELIRVSAGLEEPEELIGRFMKGLG